MAGFISDNDREFLIRAAAADTAWSRAAIDWEAQEILSAAKLRASQAHSTQGGTTAPIPLPPHPPSVSGPDPTSPHQNQE